MSADSAASAEAAVLEARQLRYHVGAEDAHIELLSGASLAVAPRTVHAVLGPNGAGKTTLLRACVGELHLAAGEVLLNGVSVAELDLADQASSRAYAGVAPHIPFPYTAAELCRLGPHEPSDEAVDEVLELLDASPFANRIASTLSAGELERVLTARALLQLWEQPGERAVLLDEPTANLDPAHQHVTMRALQAARSRGIASLLVVHDLNLASRYADAATLIKGGAVLASGPAETTLTAELLSALFDVRVSLVPVPELERPVVAVLE